jgi:hypothetical protein
MVVCKQLPEVVRTPMGATVARIRTELIFSLVLEFSHTNAVVCGFSTHTGSVACLTARAR